MDERTHFKWEGGPFKLITTPTFTAEKPGDVDAATNLASLMALIHNSWIRALNGLYVTAETVPPNEYANFVGYASRVYAAIKKHHDEEEDFVFPLVEQQTGAPGLMQLNIDQHAAFHSAFESWGNSLFHLISTKTTSSFSPKTFLTQIDAFRAPLQLHLEEEISTLQTLSNYPHVDINAMMKKAHEDTLAHMQIVELRDNMPVLLLNHDRTFEGGMHGWFPPMPPGMSFGIRRVATCWNWGYWKYATCDAGQMPREVV